MVHFHIHTNGYAEETDDDGHHIYVRPWIINAVWIGLAVLLWVTTVFLIIEAIRGIERIAA